MPMRQGERRRSRDSFTQTLRRIASRIADRPIYELEWEDPLVYRRHKCHVDISGLWVAGSYARGALDCGDLDLIIDLGSEEPALFWTSKISRTVIGRAPDVRFYVGTPENNSSGIAFPEAELIWSPTLPDWQSAISNIIADPSATRYARRNDAVPLRPEQFYIHDDTTLDQLLDLKDSRVIDWKWVPADEIKVKPRKWSNDAVKFAKHIQSHRGKKTQAVMQLVIEHFEKRKGYITWQRDWNDNGWFRFGGALVFVGRPPVRVELLNNLFCSSIVIAPHLSRRGPNGLWILSRDINHPLEQAFLKTKAYYLKNQRAPAISVVCNDWRSAQSLDIFRSRKQAERYANEEKAEFDTELDIYMAAGSDLLKLIADVDIIDTVKAWFPISEEGRRLCDESQVASVETVLALFKSK